MFLISGLRQPHHLQRYLPLTLGQRYSSATEFQPTTKPLKSILIANRGEIALLVEFAISSSSHT